MFIYHDTVDAIKLQVVVVDPSCSNRLVAFKLSYSFGTRVARLVKAFGCLSSMSKSLGCLKSASSGSLKLRIILAGSYKCVHFYRSSRKASSIRRKDGRQGGLSLKIRRGSSFLSMMSRSKLKKIGEKMLFQRDSRMPLVARRRRSELNKQWLLRLRNPLKGISFVYVAYNFFAESKNLEICRVFFRHGK